MTDASAPAEGTVRVTAVAPPGQVLSNRHLAVEVYARGTWTRLPGVTRVALEARARGHGDPLKVDDALYEPLPELTVTVRPGALNIEGIARILLGPEP